MISNHNRRIKWLPNDFLFSVQRLGLSKILGGVFESHALVYPSGSIGDLVQDFLR